MRNPFHYGQVVLGEDFADREKEIEEISRELHECSRVFLISPRRYGKTSLILNILEKLRGRNIMTAYLDMYDITTLEQFATHYARALARASESKMESIVHFIREVIPSLRPQVSISPEGDISVGVDVAVRKRDLSLLLKELLEVPEKVAKRKGRNFTVVFDEFQEVVPLGGEPLEKLMRACFQHQQSVGYLFSGSKQHIMTDMVSDRTRAFYKMGSIRFLDRIAELEFRNFIEEKFGKTGHKLSGGVAPAVIRISCGIPYYVQHLCCQIWNENIGNDFIKEDSVSKAVASIVANQSHIFLTMWDSLTLAQRQLLQAISIYGGKAVFSNSFIQNHRLKSAAAAQKSLKLLIKKNVVEKENGIYRFSDIWFAQWVKQRAA